MTSRKKVLYIIAVALVAAPYLALAAAAPGIPFWAPNGLISCTGSLNPGELGTNGQPLSTKTSCLSLCDLIDTSLNVIYFFMTLALFVFVPILFAWGGFMILTAGAKPDQLGTGKKILTSTLVGALIILGAFLIIKTIVTTLGVDLPGFTSALQCSVPATP